MASTQSGRQMYPSFKEAHEAFVAEYTALYQGFPKYLEDLVIGFGWGEDAAGQRWFIISANPQGLQHLTYPELVLGFRKLYRHPGAYPARASG